MGKEAPAVIPLQPEVAGYIQGLKDLITAQVDMIGQRTAEVFGLRAQLAEALRKGSDAIAKATD